MTFKTKKRTDFCFYLIWFLWQILLVSHIKEAYSKWEWTREEYKYLNVKRSSKFEQLRLIIPNMETAFFLISNIWEFNRSLESKMTPKSLIIENQSKLL